MWISQQLFTELIRDRSEAQGTAQALERQVQSQKITMDWLMVRLTQLEHERAQLLFNYTGVKITVPSIEAPSSMEVSESLGETLSFQDVGDEAAAKMGIEWDDEGHQISRKR